MEDSDLDIDGLQRLHEKTLEIAERGYVYDDRYGYLPQHLDVDNREWGGISETLKNIYEKDIADDIKRAIVKNTNLRNLSFLAQTDHSLVLLARSEKELCELHITAHPDSETGREDNSADCDRSAFPWVVQGLADPLDVDDILQIEILPPVLAITRILTQEEKDCFNRLLQELLKGTCYTTNGVEEFAVLPEEGMIMGFDSSDITYNSDFWQMSPKQQEQKELDSLKLIQDRIRKLTRIPDSLRWLDKRGRNKQKRLYNEIKRPEFEDNLLLMEMVADN